MPLATATGKTVAIMQPYFIPYAGYFRLFVGADLFVIYDCVQFSRRGWLHRNKLRTATGVSDWLTLPIEKAPRDVLIRDLRFRPTAAAEMSAQMRRFPALGDPPAHARPLLEAMRRLQGTPVDYIVGLLRVAAETMGLPWRVVRSSELSLPPGLRAQDRIIAIAKSLGATRYLNSPGGHALYRSEDFAAEGITLSFLDDYKGACDSIAQRLATENPETIAAEIRHCAGCATSAG